MGSVAFPTNLDQSDLQLDWSYIGLNNNYIGGDTTFYTSHGEYVNEKHIVQCHLPINKARIRLSIASPSKTRSETKTTYMAGEHRDQHTNTVGIGLVIVQEVNADEPTVWHLHQDFVVSLRLIREGDSWLRPDEGYAEVARLHRDGDDPVKLEVKSDVLRDYLCSKRLRLYLSTYRSRIQISMDRSHINWDSSQDLDNSNSIRWEGCVTEVNEHGMPYGTNFALFHASRTDVDNEEDVPVFEFPSEKDVETTQTTKKQLGEKLYRIEGELWRLEIIEPGDASERIDFDDPKHPIRFIVDAAGNTESKDTLANGAGRWLWFKPGIIEEILKHRGAHMKWYTKNTGAIGMTPGYGVPFGVNDLGLINVFAKDVANLTSWEQRKWAGFNIGPDGGVSEELLDAQMRATPADSQSPEGHLRSAYNGANNGFLRLTGRRLFKPHKITDELFSTAHRFRARDQQSLFSLAKDLSRLVVESIDGKTLSTIAPPSGDFKAGSIKHLEQVLTAISDNIDARQLTSALVGINELRHADAHLPSSDLEHSISLAGINEVGIPLHEAQQMLHKIVETLYVIEYITNQVEIEN